MEVMLYSKRPVWLFELQHWDAKKYTVRPASEHAVILRKELGRSGMIDLDLNAAYQIIIWFM